MSSVYKVLPGQNLVDIAMQVYGSAEAIVDLCADNNLEIGQEIAAGTELTIYESKIVDAKLVTYYKDKEITVSSN